MQGCSRWHQVVYALQWVHHLMVKELEVYCFTSSRLLNEALLQQMFFEDLLQKPVFHFDGSKWPFYADVPLRNYSLTH